MASQKSLVHYSPGIGMYLNAQIKKEEGTRFDCINKYIKAYSQLEDEILETKPGSLERKHLLEALYECYQFLYTESILGDHIRLLNPPNTAMSIEDLSRECTKGMIKVREELEGGCPRYKFH